MKKIYNAILFTGCSLFLVSCIKEYDNPATGTVNNVATIYSIADMYKGTQITLSADNMGGSTATHGVVISDKDAGNIEAGTFVIQQTVETPNQIGNKTNGITIAMASGAVPFVPGDSVIINLVGSNLNRVKGRLTISGVTADKITKVADNKQPFIRPVTLAMLNSDFGDYESTLVSVHADVADFAPGAMFGGERNLNDHTNSAILVTRNEAAFASESVPVNAQFTGIATYKNDTGNDTTGAKKTISLRNIADVNYSSGALYAGFPESFENPDAAEKASYNMTATANNIDLSTGNWKLQQAILAPTVIRDKYNLPGKQCIRMQQNLTTSGLVQMNFDVPDGASKVTVFYGKYYTDPTSTFRLEYSVNGGTNWTVITPNITDMPERGSKQATFMVDLSGPVRFRINKLGLGTSSPTIFNGRLCIEDIAIYKKI